jgi:hypothetical protein
MKATTVTTKDPTKLRVVLEIANLGEIPEHQQTKALNKKIEIYFNDGICDQPLAAQLRHFSAETASLMLKNELTSWLQHLNAEPHVVSITPKR